MMHSVILLGTFIRTVTVTLTLTLTDTDTVTVIPTGSVHLLSSAEDQWAAAGQTAILKTL